MIQHILILTCLGLFMIFVIPLMVGNDTLKFKLIMGAIYLTLIIIGILYIYYISQTR